jgi:hypothetical protein
VAALLSELADGYKARAQEAVSGTLGTLVAKIQGLRSRHEGLAARLHELGLAYEKSGLEKIQKQYNAILARARSLRSQILETLTESWAMLNTAGANS